KSYRSREGSTGGRSDGGLNPAPKVLIRGLFQAMLRSNIFPKINSPWRWRKIPVYAFKYHLLKSLIGMETDETGAGGFSLHLPCGRWRVLRRQQMGYSTRDA